MDHKNGLMGLPMMENSRMIKQMAEENLCIQTGTIIKEIGFKIRLKEWADIQERVEDIIKEVGKKISPKDMEYNNGAMEIFIKVNLEMD